MQTKYKRFQEIMKDDLDNNIVVTVATIQLSKNMEVSASMKNSVAHSSERPISKHELFGFKGERVEYSLSRQEFDQLLALYENDKEAFLSFTRSEDYEQRANN